MRTQGTIIRPSGLSWIIKPDRCTNKFLGSMQVRTLLLALVTRILRKNAAPAAASQACAKRQRSTIPILLATDRADDRRVLSVLLEGTKWILVHTGTWAEVLRLIACEDYPIILCDRHLRGFDLSEDRPMPPAGRSTPCVIVLSDVADPYLWDDLVQRGAFDVLARPIRKTQMLSMLEFAHTHWKTGWPTK